MDGKDDELSRNRIKTNNRYAKLRQHPKRVPRKDDTSENANLLRKDSDHTGINMVKKIKTRSMTEKTARELLGVKGYPFHAYIIHKAKPLLEKHAPENGGNPRKYREILAAERVLKKLHSGIIREFRGSVAEANNKFSANFKDSTPEEADLYTSFSTKFSDLNKSLLDDLEHSQEPSSKLINQYYKNIRAINDEFSRNSMNDKSNLKSFREKLLTAGRSLEINLDDVEKHLPYGHDLSQIEEVDDIALFQEKYNEYLDDLENLKNEYGHHQEAFQDLIDGLSFLGTEFHKAIQKPNADLNHLSAEYAKYFKATVKDAKNAFADQPSIWDSLHPILKQIFTTIFFIKDLIAQFETEDNRFRMYNPDKHSNIVQRWEQWEMDCMPELDLSKMNPKQS